MLQYLYIQTTGIISVVQRTAVLNNKIHLNEQVYFLHLTDICTLCTEPRIHYVYDRETRNCNPGIISVFRLAHRGGHLISRCSGLFGAPQSVSAPCAYILSYRFLYIYRFMWLKLIIILTINVKYFIINESTKGTYQRTVCSFFFVFLASPLRFQSACQP